jgi:RHS repeat-associated protein
VLAAKEKTVSDGEVLPQAKTRVWGLPLENANGIGRSRPASSTLHWGWSPSYDGTASGELDQRYYSPGMGRFMTPDPMKGGKAARPGSWNKYLYVHGDPVNFRDPAGLNEASPDDGCGDEEEDLPCFSVTGYGDGDDGGGGGGGYYDPCDYDPDGCDITDPTPTPDPQKQPKKGKGGKKKKSGPPAPCDSPILQSQYLTEYAQMGKDLNVNPMFIMAVSLQESGWNLSHVYGTNSSSNGQPLNNLFGSTYAGGNNIAYPNIQASGAAWEQNWGPYLTNSPQTIGAFTADLTSNPKHMYNSSAAWPGAVGNVYNTLQKEFTDCNLAFPKIP